MEGGGGCQGVAKCSEGVGGEAARPLPAAPPAHGLAAGARAAAPPRAGGGPALAAPAALAATAAGVHCRTARRHRRRHQGQPIKAQVSCRGAPPGLMWQSTHGTARRRCAGAAVGAPKRRAGGGLCAAR
ncbi:unnamed protein product [Prorocentrum cordatum]|uniref:Uncharacterized protein n=1 Tax=Prorocentrum cordatum TaxID=2364126 RepID=A0ABN9SA87_9DINO|nr:unnamed protein product [Polarella glacialis]